MRAMRRLVPALLLVALLHAPAEAEKKRRLAQALSGGGAAVSGGVVLAGFLSAPPGDAFNLPVLYTGIGMLMVTPSLGQFYAGQYVTWGMGIRALATGLAIYTLQTQTEVVTCDVVHSPDDQCKSLSSSAFPLLGVAAIGFVGGVWWDALDAGDAVDRWNRDHGFTMQPAVQTTAQSFTLGVAGAF